MADFRTSNYARGIRNNNPGNLVKTATPWQGKVPHSENTDSRFEQFTSVEMGLRALMKNVQSHIKRGKNTLEKLINIWAPTFENNTQRYINYVSRKTGFSPSEIIDADKQTLLKIAHAIVEFENGNDHAVIKNEHYLKAVEMLDNVPEVKKKV